MKISRLLLPFLFTLCLCPLQAADADKDKDKDKDVKPPATALDAGDGSWEGKLLPAPEKRGEAGIKIDGVRVALWTENKDLALKIDDLLASKATVRVTGKLLPDGKNLKVTSISEAGSSEAP